MDVAVPDRNRTFFWNAVIEITQLQIIILITLQPPLYDSYKNMGQKATARWILCLRNYEEKWPSKNSTVNAITFISTVKTNIDQYCGDLALSA